MAILEKKKISENIWIGFIENPRASFTLRD